MPGRDGTGPLGTGAGTGRGIGGCGGTQSNGQYVVYRAGRQRRAGHGGMQRHGAGRGFAGGHFVAAQKDALEQQRAALQAKLEQVDVQPKNV